MKCGETEVRNKNEVVIKGGLVKVVPTEDKHQVVKFSLD